MTNRYVKKPVIIEAIQLTWQNWNEICDFVKVPEHGRGIEAGDAIKMEIYTLEGTMIANENDYIIKGIKGEFYPCKPDIFEATYQIVN